MKKMKMFFAVAALSLVTVGVFAGKSSLFASYGVYDMVNSTTFAPIDANVGTSAVLGTLSTTTNANGVITAKQGATGGIVGFYTLPASTTTFVGYAYSSATF